MRRAQSYYDLFGLNQDATAQEIRASYLRLLKQHHPDRIRTDETPARPELVPILNRCYSVLKDPQKRAAYDAALLGNFSLPAPHIARPSRHLTIGWTSKRSVLWAAVVFAGVSLISLVLLQQVAPRRLLESEGRTTWPISKGPASGSAEPAAEDIRRQAHLARSVSDHKAVQMSQDCFASARRDQKLSSTELCILFDQAFLYWRKAPGDLAFLPIYYNDEVMQIRHMGALAGMGQDDMESKLDDLREEAFRALLQDVSGSGQTIAQGAAAANSGEARNVAAEDVQLTPSVSK